MLVRVSVPSPNHGGARDVTRLLVVHTSEGAQTWRSLGNFLANPEAKVSYHVGFDNVDANQIGSYVQPPLTSWSAHQANHLGEHGCCCTPSGASSGWTRADWLARPKMLQACRQWLAEEGARYRIPVRKISAAQIRAGAAGVCGHADCVAAGLGGTHTDPGPGFPWDVVTNATPPEPQPPPVSIPGGQEMFWIGSTDGKYHLFGPKFTQEIDSQQALRLASMGIPHQVDQHPLVVISMSKACGTWGMS